MRPYLRRVPVQRPRRLLSSPPSRSLMLQAGSRERPQLPFLSSPVTTAAPGRLFTTETRRWIRSEVYFAMRWSFLLLSVGGCLGFAYAAYYDEQVERRHPTPPEWRFWTRFRLRGALHQLEFVDTVQQTDGVWINWDVLMQSALELVRRLEDPALDGAGLKTLLASDEPLSVADLGRAGYDITGKSEPWRRGYYQALMILARISERVDGWVLDRTRGLVFPPEVVRGASNPFPKPIKPGMASAPRDTDCEPAFEPTENYYLRILTTRGFTARQKMDTALAYASFLEFKQLPDAAEEMYEWAASLALEGSDIPSPSPPTPSPFDPKTYVLRESPTAPSANVLSAVTAIATYKARTGDVASALPIFLSLLRARRSLPAKPATAPAEPTPPSLVETVRQMIQMPPYPPPPDDGTTPPAWRDAQDLCQEAALQLYIGEILYVSSQRQGREEGLAWTRDAVDTAEEQLRELKNSAGADKVAEKACRECLGTGLENWTSMLAKLAREEERNKVGASAQAASSSSLWSFWSKPADAPPADRWSAEQKVVEERTRRTRELLEVLEPPSRGLLSFLKA